MKETAYWTWFMIAGIVMLVFAGLHMASIHLSAVFACFNPAGSDSTAWSNVAFRSKSAFFVFSYIVILAAALYHGFYGLRTILFEAGLKQSARRPLTVFLWVVGLGLFVFGTYAAVASKSAALMI